MKEGYTRVTEALYPFSGYGAVDPIVLKKAADKGTIIHGHITNIISGVGEWGVEPMHQPFIDSFYAWWEAFDIVPIYQNHRYYCDKHMITGEIDLFAEVDGRPCIVDFKTSYTKGSTWGLQGSAYKYLHELNEKPVDFIFLHLDRTGKPAKICEYPYEIEDYLACLRCYRRFYGVGGSLHKDQTPMIFDE